MNDQIDQDVDDLLEGEELGDCSGRADPDAEPVRELTPEELLEEARQLVERTR